jgi:hypothetical protein
MNTVNYFFDNKQELNNVISHKKYLDNLINNPTNYDTYKPSLNELDISNSLYEMWGRRLIK